MKTIAILGGSGKLGVYLNKELKNNFKIISASTKSSLKSCDITKSLSIKRFILKFKPDIIVNTAALTSIELCEKNPKKAFKINSESIIKLLKNISRKTYFVHISTDQVYPNLKGPFNEKQITNKGENIYAKSKIRAEKLLKNKKNVLILRTNFFGNTKLSKKKSLSDIIIENSIKNISMPLFEDLFFSPLHISTLCKYIKICISKKIIGTYNIGSKKGISKAEFGLKILNFLNLQTKSFYIKNTDDIKSRIPRSKDLRLDCSLIENKLFVKLPSIEKEIEKLKLNN